MNLEEATKRITLEYIKTGCKGYQTLLKYINSKMTGSLFLANTKVSYLPEGLKVGKDLDIYNTPITTLPKNLKVGRCLDLNNTPVTVLPEGLNVNKILYLQKTLITTLPKDLKVGGFLFLNDTPISKIYTKEQLKQMLPNVKGQIYI